MIDVPRKPSWTGRRVALERWAVSVPVVSPGAVPVVALGERMLPVDVAVAVVSLGADRRIGSNNSLRQDMSYKTLV
jgi:hypothetical protein